MARATKVEDRHARLALVHDSGRGRLSWVSTDAGVLSGFGAFAVVLGIAVAIAQVVGIDARGFSRGEWRAIGLGSGIATAIVVFGAWWFGGYVAGRMARRAGASHGIAVFVTTLVVLVVAAAIVWAEGGPTTIRDGLHTQGAPTDGGTWWGIGALTGLLCFVGGLAGSFLGGIRGERWHQHLLEDALDPEIGPEAEARREAEARNEAARDRVATTSPRSGVVPAATGAGAGAAAAAAARRERDDTATHDDGFLRADDGDRRPATRDGGDGADRRDGRDGRRDDRVVPVVAPDAPVPVRGRGTAGDGRDTVDVSRAERDERPDERDERGDVLDERDERDTGRGAMAGSVRADDGDDTSRHRFARWVRSGR